MIKNSNFGYQTEIDGQNLEYWSNSDYEHYYKINKNTNKYELQKRNRTTNKVLNYDLFDEKERLDLLREVFGKPNSEISSSEINQKPYSFFDKYFDQYYKVNINTNEHLSQDIDVCKVLEKYADYLLFAPNADPLYDKTKYKIIDRKELEKLEKCDVSLESLKSEFLLEHSKKNKGKGTYINQEFNKLLNESIDEQPFMYFEERNNNFYLLNNQKIYRKDLKDKEIGKYIEKIYENIEKIKEFQKNHPKTKMFTDKMIGDLKIKAIDYKNGIKRPIEMKKLSKGTTEIDYTLCNYWNAEQIKQLLRCPVKNLLTGLGELIYDLDQLINKTNFTPRQKQILNLWRTATTDTSKTEEEQNGMIQKSIADDLGCSQSFVSQSITNICNKIVNTYLEEYEDWLYLNWLRGEYKKCSRCGEIKLISKFYTDSSKKDGYKYICKECC